MPFSVLGLAICFDSRGGFPRSIKASLGTRFRSGSPMGCFWLVALVSVLGQLICISAEFQAGQQRFLQEVANTRPEGSPMGPIQIIERQDTGTIKAFHEGHWYELKDGHWAIQEAPAIGVGEFPLTASAGRPVLVKVPWREVHQVLRKGELSYIATGKDIAEIRDGKITRSVWPNGYKINQMALDPQGQLHVASEAGLFRQTQDIWEKIEVADEGGRDWGVREVRGIAFDSKGRLWIGTKAGVGCRTGSTWQFYEGKDGLPWSDFTWITTDSSADIWFATHLGVVRFDGTEWQYRQGPRWLPNDDVAAVAVDEAGTAWFATASGIGSIERWPMTLAQKASFYEQEIERYIKRTPFGFVAEANLREPANKATANPQDSDNDGLWTAMYGAGECFAYGTTKDPQAKARAKKAFEALRFLQSVTQGCEHAPPKGYVARTIRPVEWPDPNVGRLQSDRQEQQNDKFWKAYEPRWPKSADGKWFWKSDTSSDELDGHFFFYPLYYDLCADSEPERERVREVVTSLVDHLISHGFCLIDHDGKPTRWGIYGPQFLNEDPYWWQERGLKSLSILAYLAVASHVSDDPKYVQASHDLCQRYGYAHNAMYPKVQQGPGSGNQSDDEMAVMCFYSLLRCSKDENLKALIRYSFFRYWVNEAPEMNPFFNFAYAGQNLSATSTSPWGQVSLRPWKGWLEDSMATLYGFSLDRLNWPSRNSHRLDIVDLPRVRSEDLDTPDRQRTRGNRVNGKVLPVENRHFNHWNTDPWQLDYGGNGGELAAGTVFLLPYYMGLYHGFIEKEAR